MTYTCKLCSKTSGDVEFYKGVTSRCKECHKRKVRENRADKSEYYREYDAKRFKEDPKVRARHIRYQATDAGKASIRASRDKWLEENQDKRAAHVILGNAVRSGRKTRPDTCGICGEPADRIEGHHEDYAKPLDVIWCCRMCHVDIHRKLKGN